MDDPLTARTSHHAYLGTVLHAPVRGQIELLRDALIVTDAEGRIEAVHRHETADAAALARRFEAQGALQRLDGQDYLLPGMIDLHVHAPQWPQIGTALDLPLEEWLQRHTFPLEARFADVEYAQRVYAALVDALLANGTTTAVYYGSLHLQSTLRLAEICLHRPQRALIGRVAMDDPRQCPDFYRDSSAAVALAETRALIAHIEAMPGNEAGLIQPVITPRFIPACSDELLRGLGALAQATQCRVQTHCSESDWEHRYVRERCGCSDAAALDGFGLLSRRTILAHGNFIAADDAALIARLGAAIAHCPLSNVYFSDAVFPLRRMLDAGLRVGLGTDIAGGASPSIIDNARQAVIASRMLEAGVDAAEVRARRRREGARIDAATAFWLATAGGGAALDLPIGLFRAGYQFDAILLDGSGANGNLRLGPADSPENLVQKIIYQATRANIRAVWVAGRPAYLAPSRAA